MINLSRCLIVLHTGPRNKPETTGKPLLLDCLFSPDGCPISKPLAPGGFTVAISDELNVEEQAIMVFLKRYFETAGMPNALWILNESENISDVRAILDGYREFYRKYGTH